MVSRAKQRLDSIPLEKVGKSILEKLQHAGIETVEDILRTNEQQLTSIQGIGKKTAEKIIESVKKYFEEE